MSATSMILKSPDETEDAVQAACWKAFEHVANFRGDASFNNWLTTITANQARMRRRQLRRAKLVLVEDAPNPADVRLRDAMPNAEELYAGEELVRMLNREIRRLPAQLRHAMPLHIQNLTVAEVAERLGVSLSRLLRHASSEPACASTDACGPMWNCERRRRDKDVVSHCAA